MNTQTQEALKMAREHIKRVMSRNKATMNYQWSIEAIEAIDEALAQHIKETAIRISEDYKFEWKEPAQEPVAWVLEWTFNGDERGRRLYNDETHCVFDAENDGGVCRPLVYGDTTPQAQPAQEPVAWMYRKRNGEMTSTLNKDFALIVECDGYHVTKLYDHPAPARKPLSDKRLNIIASEWHLNLLNEKDKKDIFEFARAIEKAHGIGE